MDSFYDQPRCAPVQRAPLTTADKILPVQVPDASMLQQNRGNVFHQRAQMSYNAWKVQQRSQPNKENLPKQVRFESPVTVLGPQNPNVGNFEARRNIMSIQKGHKACEGVLPNKNDILPNMKQNENQFEKSEGLLKQKQSNNLLQHGASLRHQLLTRHKQHDTQKINEQQHCDNTNVRPIGQKTNENLLPRQQHCDNANVPPMGQKTNEHIVPRQKHCDNTNIPPMRQKAIENAVRKPNTGDVYNEKNSDPIPAKHNILQSKPFEKIYMANIPNRCLDLSIIEPPRAKPMRPLHYAESTQIETKIDETLKQAQMLKEQMLDDSLQFLRQKPTDYRKQTNDLHGEVRNGFSKQTSEDYRKQANDLHGRVRNGYHKQTSEGSNDYRKQASDLQGEVTSDYRKQANDLHGEAPNDYRDSQGEVTNVYLHGEVRNGFGKQMSDLQGEVRSDYRKQASDLHGEVRNGYHKQNSEVKNDYRKHLSDLQCEGTNGYHKQTSDKQVEVRNDYCKQTSDNYREQMINSRQKQVTQDDNLEQMNVCEKQVMNRQRQMCNIQTEVMNKLQKQMMSLTTDCQKQTSDPYKQTPSDFHKQTTHDHHKEIIELHKLATSNLHKQTTSDLHKHMPSDLHKQTASNLHKQTTSDLHKQTASDLYKQTTGNLHKQTTSNIHKQTIGELHSQTTTDLHKQTTSNPHKQPSDDPSVKDLLRIIQQQNEQLSTLQKQVDTLLQERNEIIPKANPFKNRLFDANKFAFDVMTSFEVSIRPPPNRKPVPKITEIIEDDAPEVKKNTDVSLTLNEPLVVREECPSPENSIHIDMQDFSSSESEDESSNHSSLIGWTIYNNVMDQVNFLINKSQGDECKSKPNKFGTATMQKVKEATLRHLKSVGVNLPNMDETDSTQKNDSGLQYSPTEVSFAVKQLLMKYLPSEHLARIGEPDKRTEVKQPTNLIKRRPDFSMATVQYMEKYNLLKKTGTGVKRDGKLLDITALKQQPKLL